MVRNNLAARLIQNPYDIALYIKDIVIPVSYTHLDQDKGHTRKIVQRYRISKSEAYNRANEAVRHLTRLIFW